MHAELKPCPFCGAEAKLREHDGRYCVQCRVEMYWCEVCPCTWTYNTPEEAVEAWNTRKGEKE